MGRVCLRSLGVLALVCAGGCFFDHAGLEQVGDTPDGAVDAPQTDGEVADVPLIDVAVVDVAVIDANVDAEVIDAAPDACVPAVESCNGLDDNCDGTVDEGFGVGTPCDGPDTDLCADDSRVCNGTGTGTICANTSGDDDAEICNGGDDDCDGMIDEGFMVGMLCDGADGDVCQEGTWACNGLGGVACSDMTGTTVETCNFVDDDCDGAIDTDADTSSDAMNCGACFNMCSNGNGTTSCIGGVCTPVCVGANDCDGDPDNGCELLRDTNPLCLGAASGGTVSGDFGSDVITLTGTTEAQYTFTISENVSGPNNPNATIQLQSPAGMDFDLYAMCDNCFAATIYSSTMGPGMMDVLNMMKTDISGNPDTFTVRVEVRYASSTVCGTWTLTVSGNTDSATTATCL